MRGHRAGLRAALAAAVAATLLGGAVALAARAATASERRAIIAAVKAQNALLRQAPAKCDRADVVRVSVVDARYAIWSQNGALAARISSKCAVGDGYIILRKQPNGRWRIRTEGSGEAPCSQIGTRIARDLVGPAIPCA